MPFCSQCGNEVSATDVYCGRCGRRQVAEAAPNSSGSHPDPLAGIPPRTASILCYVPAVGWICAIIVLASVKFRNNRPVRFHAFQNVLLIRGDLIADFVIRPMFWVMPNNLHLYQLIQLVLL